MRWTPAIEADEFEAADKKAEEELQAGVVAAGRTALNAAEEAKRDSLAREKQERTVFSTEKEWNKARIKQVRQWFYNHHPKKQSNQPSIKFVIGAEKRKTVLTETQIYSKTYYPARVKAQADVNAALVEPKYKLDARNKAVSRALAEEDDDVKAEMRRKHEEMKEERVKGLKALETVFRLGEGDAVKSPEECLRVIQILPQVLKSVFTSLGAGSGWNFSVYGGGPNPAHPQGDICTISYHHGIDINGQNFREANPQFYQNTKVEFTKFLRASFDSATRQSRSLGAVEKAGLAVLLAQVAENGIPVTFDGERQLSGMPELDGAAVVETTAGTDAGVNQSITGTAEAGGDALNDNAGETGMETGNNGSQGAAGGSQNAEELPEMDDDNDDGYTPPFGAEGPPASLWPGLQPLPGVAPLVGGFDSMLEFLYADDTGGGSNEEQIYPNNEAMNLHRDSSSLPWLPGDQSSQGYGGYLPPPPVGSPHANQLYLPPYNEDECDETSAHNNYTAASTKPAHASSTNPASTNPAHIPAPLPPPPPVVPKPAAAASHIPAPPPPAPVVPKPAAAASTNVAHIPAPPPPPAPVVPKPAAAASHIPAPPPPAPVVPKPAAAASTNVANIPAPPPPAPPVVPKPAAAASQIPASPPPAPVVTKPAAAASTNVANIPAPPPPAPVVTKPAAAGSHIPAPPPPAPVVSKPAATALTNAAHIPAPPPAVSKKTPAVPRPAEDPVLPAHQIQVPPTVNASNPAVLENRSSKRKLPGDVGEEEDQTGPSEVGASKRTRKAQLPDDVHGWVSSHVRYLMLGMDEADPVWSDCVACWERFELNNGRFHQTGGRFRATRRPAEMAKWTQSSDLKKIPEVVDVPAFANAWVAWWHDVQPEWRKGLAGMLPTPLEEGKDADLRVLKKPGPSGMVMFIMSLKWWACVRDVDERWRRAVVEVSDCLRRMA